MNVFDSNVEALAFNYFTFAFLTPLNNLWTCLALLTAALSFWKIRTAGCPKPHAPVSVRPDPVLETDEVTPEETEPETAFCNGARKSKFTMYYEEDMQCGESEELLTASEEWEEREGFESEWWKQWERLLRLRNGENENGWYTWQDLTELNGNVVRLWDNSSCIHAW